jgi:hypothetical protein
MQFCCLFIVILIVNRGLERCFKPRVGKKVRQQTFVPDYSLTCFYAAVLGPAPPEHLYLAALMQGV